MSTGKPLYVYLHSCILVIFYIESSYYIGYVRSIWLQVDGSRLIHMASPFISCYDDTNINAVKLN